jgi:hypothetical protein
MDREVVATPYAEARPLGGRLPAFYGWGLAGIAFVTMGIGAGGPAFVPGVSWPGGGRRGAR